MKRVPKGFALIQVLLFLSIVIFMVSAVFSGLTSFIDVSKTEKSFWMLRGTAYIGLAHCKGWLTQTVNLADPCLEEAYPLFGQSSDLELRVNGAQTPVLDYSESGIGLDYTIYRLGYPSGYLDLEGRPFPRMPSIVVEKCDVRGQFIRTEPKRYYLVRSSAHLHSRPAVKVVFEECVALSLEPETGIQKVITVFLKHSIR